MHNDTILAIGIKLGQAGLPADINNDDNIEICGYGTIHEREPSGWFFIGYEGETIELKNTPELYELIEKFGAMADLYPMDAVRKVFEEE